MENNDIGAGPVNDDNGVNRQDGVGESSEESTRISQAVHLEARRVARAKLIEDTTYRMTDLITIVSGRIEILSEKVPERCREELLAIRKEMIKGIELNERMLLAALACRAEIGR